MATTTDKAGQKTAAADPARARRYGGFLKGDNEAEKEFKRVLPIVTHFVNAALRTKGYAFDISEAEIATNFISEGGYYALNGNVLTGLDGFQYLGVDNYVAMRTAYRPFVPKEVDKLADDPAHIEKATNEKKESVTTLQGMTLEQGMHLNAGAFAWAMAAASRDIKEFSTLPRTARFFWGTIYYNSGPGTGRNLYKRFGVGYWHHGWKGKTENQLSPLFNATWRTRSMELLAGMLPPPGAAAEKK